MLPLFGGYFTPDPILIDGIEINEYLNMLEENGGTLPVEGLEHGQMLFASRWAWRTKAWSFSSWTFTSSHPTASTLLRTRCLILFQWSGLKTACPCGEIQLVSPTLCDADVDGRLTVG